MAPDFDSKAEALAHAQALIAQLKAAGYSVTLVDETADAGAPPPDLTTQAEPTTPDKGGEGSKHIVGELDPAIVTWLMKTGGAASPPAGKKGKPKKKGPVPAAVMAEPDILLSEAEAQDAGAGDAPTGAGADGDGGPAQDLAAEPLPSEPVPILPPPPIDTADLAGPDIVTPLSPDLWDVAKETGSAGVPLLMGGEDLEDMQATVVVYRGYADFKHKEWPVVWCKVRPQAEEKIMAAIAAAQGKQYVTVKKQIKTHGRAPFDLDGQVAEKIVTYAKSINHHVGEGTPIPDQTVYGVSSLLSYIVGVKNADLSGEKPLSEGERKLLEGYYKDVGELAAAIMDGTKTPRKDYGPRQGSFILTVEEQIPLPADPSHGLHLSVTERPATRIEVSEKDGVAYWDGWRRYKIGSDTREIVIDFGDGWTAIYRPHADGYKIPWSYKGTLEMHAPPGADPTGIAMHLNRLYLHGEPMSRVEAEAIYLERNAWAQGLTGTQGYRDIQRYVAARTQVLAAELVVSGEYAPDDAGMAAAVRAAGRIALREKIGLLRRLFEKRMGLPEGGLAKLPRYRPEPMWETVKSAGKKQPAPGGYFVWNRFDVDPQQVRKLFGTQVLGHTLTGDGWDNLKKMILGNGVFASQEKRHQMGAKAGKTMSPNEDTHSGGAAYVFLRVVKPGQTHIEWNPAVLLERSDWFFRNADNFGATNPKNYHYKGEFSTDPEKASKATSSSNEICFKNGLSLFGRYAPIRINAGPYRENVLGWFKQAGITHLGGRPVEEVVK